MRSVLSKKFPKLTSTLVILDHFSQKKGIIDHFNGLLVPKLKGGKKCLFSKSCPVFAKDFRTVQYLGVVGQKAKLWAF